MLYRGQAAVYCAPSYRDELGLETPGDLVRATLINDTKHHWWADWLATFAGIDPDIDHNRLIFNSNGRDRAAIDRIFRTMDGRCAL